MTPAEVTESLAEIKATADAVLNSLVQLRAVLVPDEAVGLAIELRELLGKQLPLLIEAAKKAETLAIYTETVEGTCEEI